MKKAGLLSFIATLLLNGLSAQVPNYVPAQNLVGWWPMNGNLVDSSANTNDGSGYLNTFQADRFGLTNKACNFANNSGYVRINNLPVNMNGNYSINYWMKLNNYVNFDVVMDFHPSEACDAYPQVWQQHDSLFIVKCDQVSTRKPLGHKDVFLNKWVMVTHLIKSDTTFLYIDGVLRSKFPYTWGTSANANLILGNATNYSVQYATGAEVTLDDIGLWSRLLSDCEISGLFNSTPPMVITNQPASQTGNAGSSVSFSVTASGLATYQWQSNIGSGGTFIDLPNTGQYSGVTSNTLTVSSLTAINNNQLFRCLVTASDAGCGSIISNIVSVGVTTLGINDQEYYTGSVLEQNVPNPASGNTAISYYVRAFKKNASVLVCDASGRKVWSENIAQPGKGQFVLGHQQLEQGVYFYTLIIDGFKASTRKMIIIR